MVPDEEYVRREMRDNDKDGGNTMQTLRWDGASLRKVRYFVFSVAAPSILNELIWINPRRGQW